MTQPNEPIKKLSRKESLIVVGSLIGIVLAVTSLSRFLSPPTTPKPTPAAAPAKLLMPEDQKFTRETPEEQADEKRIETGKLMARIGAIELRGAMRNPASFELVQALLMKDGTICYTYRAQNGFGGMNLEAGVMDAKSGHLKVDGVSGFESSWNHRCAHKTGKDVTSDAG